MSLPEIAVTLARNYFVVVLETQETIHILFVHWLLESPGAICGPPLVNR